MGFFDEIFDHNDIPRGLIVRSFDFDSLTNKETIDVEVGLLKGLNDDAIVVKCDESGDVMEVKRDETKAVKAEHWDNLTEEARNVLLSQGFYRKSENTGNVNLI